MRGWGAGDAETDSEKAGEGRTGGGRGRLGPALSPPAPGLSLPSGSTLRGQAPWLGILRAPASHLGRHSVSQVQGWALLSEEPGHPPPPSLLRGPPPARWRHQLQRSRLPRAWEIRFPLPGRGSDNTRAWRSACPPTAICVTERPSCPKCCERRTCLVPVLDMGPGLCSPALEGLSPDVADACHMLALRQALSSPYLLIPSFICSSDSSSDLLRQVLLSLFHYT